MLECSHIPIDDLRSDFEPRLSADDLSESRAKAERRSVLDLLAPSALLMSTDDVASPVYTMHTSLDRMHIGLYNLLSGRQMLYFEGTP